MPFPLDPQIHPVSSALQAAFAGAIGIDGAAQLDGSLGDALAGALGAGQPARAAIAGDRSSLFNFFSDLRDAQAEGTPERQRLASLAELYGWWVDHDDLEEPQILVVSLAMAQIGAVSQRQNVGIDRLYELFEVAFEGRGFDRQDKDGKISWCGVFVAWAFKVAGFEVRPWKIGPLPWDDTTRFERVNSPLRMGDVGVMNGPGENTHQYLVVRELGEGKLLTVDGNTVPNGTGNDRLGGQVAAQTKRTIVSTTAFYRHVTLA